MGTPKGLRRFAAAIVLAATLSGCFGYNHGAKGWAYVADSLLIVGGGAAIGADEATKPSACTGPTCPTYTSPVSGALVAGAALIAAGVIGMVLNATRTSAHAAAP